ncbi:MAG: hypothetical protein HYT62_02030 [Candidatus Yanofskybacteria bacterium]|nr:hypothetical protein [Candidatus Yanofskybacteria bacterium]
MKNKNIFSILMLLGAFVFSGYVLAQDSGNPGNISFPVAELGNCSSKSACKEYCDKPENTSVCLDFAEKNNLMSQAELSKAKKLAGGGAKGPGGCRGFNECKQYCDDINHIDECVTFAEENNLMAPDELAEAKKIKAAVGRGVKPPACKNKKECDSYCSQGDNMEECINFAEQAGFLSSEELGEAKKVLKAIKSGIKPPACRGKAECDVYCSEDAHFQECISFAEAAGMIPPEELQMIKKTGGKGPGGCRGKDACDKYCESNMEVCMQFALDNGLIKPEEAEMMKKTGGKGPGGCRGKEECESFCNDPANQETCFNFAKDNGLMPPEELKRMEEGREQMKGAVSNMPAEVRDCLKAGVGEEVLSKLESGTFLPSRDVGEKMGACFQKMGPPQGQQGPDQGPGPNGMPPQGPGGQPGEFRGGPGGCTSPEECRSYCESHPQECGLPPGAEGNMPPPSDQRQGPPPGAEGNMPPPYDQRPSGEFRPPEGQMPPEGYQRPPGEYPLPSDGQVPQGYQIPPNYQQPPEGQMPPEGYQPPPGGYIPPSDNQAPPPDYQQQAPQDYQTRPVEQNYAPPPAETAPPPAPATEPVSIIFRSLRAALLFVFEPVMR